MLAHCDFVGSISDTARRDMERQLAPVRADGIPARLIVAETCNSDLIYLLANSSANARLLVIFLGQDRVPDSAALILLAAGADEVLYWSRLSDPVAEISARLNRWSAVEEVLVSPLVSRTLFGQSQCWIRALRRIIEVALFTDASIILTGDSGTGKELVAQMVHKIDPRRKAKAFAVVDCATIVPELSGSEFFGHERGAFTSAYSSREGAFAQADGGIVFLDEIGELPLIIQGQLLRVLQEGTYKRVGSNAWRTVDARFVAATNRDLPAEVEAGHFRSDLYFRLARWTFTLPPLRQRGEDLLPLARHFVAELDPLQRDLHLDPAVERFLAMREYPGNVRELRQVVLRMLDRHPGNGEITIGDIADCDRPPGGSPVWPDNIFRESIGAAVRQGLSLSDISSAARQEAAKAALAGARSSNGSSQRKGDVLQAAAEQLQCSRRWIEQLTKS